MESRQVLKPEMERENRSFWSQSAASVREERIEQKGRENREAYEGSEARNRIPYQRARLENSYGGIHLGLTEKGEIEAAFVRKQSFGEERVAGNKKRLNTDRSVDEALPFGRIRSDSSDQAAGAAAIREERERPVPMMVKDLFEIPKKEGKETAARMLGLEKDEAAKKQRERLSRRMRVLLEELKKEADEKKTREEAEDWGFRIRSGPQGDWLEESLDGDEEEPSRAEEDESSDGSDDGDEEN